jgi:hypothetical protein
MESLTEQKEEEDTKGDVLDSEPYWLVCMLENCTSLLRALRILAFYVVLFVRECSVIVGSCYSISICCFWGYVPFIVLRTAVWMKPLVSLLYSCSCIMTIVLALSACVIINNSCSIIVFFMSFRVFHSCFAVMFLGVFLRRCLIVFAISCRR